MLLTLSFPHWLMIGSFAISIAGASVYIRDTVAGRTKPNRVSWTLWALFPLIGTGAALSAGADFWVTARIFLAGFLPLIIVVASFVNRQSYWKLTRFDYACGLCALVALGAWFGADSPRMAILFAALGDGLAALPTLRKTWKNPETETGVTYLASFTAMLLMIPSIPNWRIENSAFQIYLIVMNTLLLISVYRRSFPLISRKNR